MFQAAGSSRGTVSWGGGVDDSMTSIVVFKGGRALSNDVARQGAKDAAIGVCCWHTNEGRPMDDGIVK